MCSPNVPVFLAVLVEVQTAPAHHSWAPQDEHRGLVDANEDSLAPSAVEGVGQVVVLVRALEQHSGINTYSEVFLHKYNTC